MRRLRASVSEVRGRLAKERDAHRYSQESCATNAQRTRLRAPRERTLISYRTRRRDDAGADRVAARRLQRQRWGRRSRDCFDACSSPALG
jgi:hypothetical protein